MRLCGKETQKTPITPFYFESRWNLDYSGQFLGIEFDPATGQIRRLHLDDPGTENDGWYETQVEVAEFCRMYPKTAHAVQVALCVSWQDSPRRRDYGREVRCCRTGSNGKTESCFPGI